MQRIDNPYSSEARWDAFSIFSTKPFPSAVISLTSKISTWLYRIAVNESLDHLRRQKTKVSADEDISVANRLLADEYFNGDETQALLQQAIAKLPDVQRTEFTLRYYDNMKYSEMSRVMNTSEGALKASYHIAVKKIHDYVLNFSND